MSVIPSGKKGEKSYNARAYAKLCHTLQVYKENFPFCYAITQTLGEDYTDLEPAKAARQFYNDVGRFLYRFSSSYGCRSMQFFEPQENGKVHAHILLFAPKRFDKAIAQSKTEPLSEIERQKIFSVFQMGGDNYLELVFENKIDRSLSYMAKCTRYTANDYLDAIASGDVDLKEKAEKSLRSIMFTRAWGIKAFKTSGLKGLEMKNRVSKKSPSQNQENELPTNAIEEFLNTGVRTNEYYSQMKVLIEKEYPCATKDIFIKSPSQNQGKTKIQRMVLAAKSAGHCPESACARCPIKKLYNLCYSNELRPRYD